MKFHGIFFLLVLTGLILLAGCSQPSGTAPVATPLSSPSPAIVTAAPPLVPQPVVTLIRYISLTRDIRDSGLLFALQVPVEWNVSTVQLVRADYPEYRTDLVSDTVFSLYSYSITRNREQEFIGEFRQWSPKPRETVVTINNITFDRFESAADGVTRVAYVVRRTSANERTYANVLVFAARDSRRFELEDFEKVVASFRYFSAKSAGTVPGEEIPVYDRAGNALSREPAGGRSLAWGEWVDDSAGEDSSDSDSPAGDSSDGGSTGGGGGCGCG